ncbi:MAG: hypothetical protein ACYC2U_00020 [Candidatus Amoebophilus sp.]
MNRLLDSAMLKFISRYTKFTDLDTMPFADYNNNNYNVFETVTRDSKVNGSALNLNNVFYNLK